MTRKNFTKEEKQAYKENKKQQLKEIREELKKGVRNIYTTDNYVNYLNFMQSFHNYSVRNTIWLFSQARSRMQNVSLFASYTDWHKKNRYIKKGEKAFTVLAPLFLKYDIKKENENGEIESQEIEYMSFKPVPVFDISQTEGEQVPTLCNELIDKNNIEQLENFKNKIIETSTVPIEFSEIYDGSKGFYTPTNNTITIKSNMSISHTIKTLIHETAHSILHNLDAINIKELSKEDKEIQAESVAYCVCKYFGLDTSSYSFDYIATWSNSKTTQELEKNMKTIKDTTDLLIKRYEA